MGNLARKPLLPDFEGSVFEGYAVNYVDRNLWRVEYGLGSREDAVSEAKLVYYLCRQRYGAKVQNRKHFMALYKRMISTWFTDWSNWDTREKSLQTSYPQPESSSQEGPLMILLNEASSELKNVVQLIINAPAEILSVLREESKQGADLFFSKAVELSGISREKVPALQQELERLLT